MSAAKRIAKAMFHGAWFWGAMLIATNFTMSWSGDHWRVSPWLVWAIIIAACGVASCFHKDDSEARDHAELARLKAKYEGGEK